MEAVEEPFAALSGAAEGGCGAFGASGEGGAEGFGVEGAVVVPAEVGAVDMVGAEGGFVALAAVDADGGDDELGVEEFGVGGGGVVGVSPGFEALGDEGVVVGSL